MKPIAPRHARKEYNQAKDIIVKRIYIETAKTILPIDLKFVLDGKGGERALPYLPLDRFSKAPQPARRERTP